MRFDMFDIKEFIDLGHLKEITSPQLFTTGGIPDPNGLISNEIFGVSTRSRKETWAYIDLHGYFFHPHIYKVLLRLFRNIQKIVSGEAFYVLGDDGSLIRDDINGQTGIQFLYDNWEKIKWNRNEGTSMRNERIDVITGYPKNIIFMRYQIVIPAYTRDIKTNQGGGNSSDDINTYYQRLIRYSSTIQNQGMFDIQFNMAHANIQNTIVQIYDYFKDRLRGKKGIMHRYLLGKSCDYCTRTVITSATYQSNTPEDLEVSFEYSSIPLPQICALLAPFMKKYVLDFFENNIIANKTSLIVYDPKTDTIVSSKEVVNPEITFSDKYVDKLLETYMKDPESRFNKIKVPVKDGSDMYLTLTGTKTKSGSEDLGIVQRPMSWTDLLYIGACQIVKDKHAMITRYPVLDEYGTFVTKIKISTTLKTTPMIIDGIFYKNYPVVDFDTPHDKVGSLFVEATRFSNSYLEGIDGDYDGDQTTIKIPFTQEANEELEKYMYRLDNFIKASGGLVRTISKEALQTFFVLTKENTEAKALSKEDTEFFCKLDPKDITLESFVSWFGDTKDITETGDKKVTKSSRFNVYDTITITPSLYQYVKEPIKTTIGRLIFYKVMVERQGFTSIIPFINDTLTASKFKSVQGKVTAALKDGKINTNQMIKYIDTRDWFGLEMHAIITTSFSPLVIKTPKEVKELKKKLIAENKTAIEAGDPVVVDKIAKQLLDKEMEILKNDYGLDLFTSGARGSVSNHLKNLLIMRGATYNSATNKYDIITNSLFDGLDKKDIPTHSNTLTQGSYSKGIGTGTSGYLSKELIAAMQTEILSPDRESDCGTNKTLLVELTDKNIGDYLYRYVVVGSKTVLIDNDNKSSFIGKTVKMRSPMYCRGVGGNQHMFCSRCFGDLYYRLNKTNVGLLAPVTSGTVSNLNLQKFHDNQVKLHHLDINDMLV